MEFTLIFEGSNDYAINSDYSNLPLLCGLHHLDLARKNLGINLPAERLTDRIWRCEGSVKITLNEEQARQASEVKNLFDFEPKVRIITNSSDSNNRFLNKYLILDFEVSKNQETGEILNFQFKYKPDKERILSDWFEAGCPTRWGFDYEKDQEAIDLANN